MFPQVQEKGITRPTTFDFHDIEGNASKKILKGGTYPNSMSLEWVETCSLGGDLQEFMFCETMVRAIDNVSKERAICGRIVDGQMSPESRLWIKGPPDLVTGR